METIESLLSPVFPNERVLSKRNVRIRNLEQNYSPELARAITHLFEQIVYFVHYELLETETLLLVDKRKREAGKDIVSIVLSVVLLGLFAKYVTITGLGDNSSLIFMILIFVRIGVGIAYVKNKLSSPSEVILVKKNAITNRNITIKGETIEGIIPKGEKGFLLSNYKDPTSSLSEDMPFRFEITYVGNTSKA